MAPALPPHFSSRLGTNRIRPGVLMYIIIILALRRRKQVDLCRFQARLGYVTSSVPARAMYPVLKKKKKLMIDSWSSFA